MGNQLAYKEQFNTESCYDHTVTSPFFVKEMPIKTTIETQIPMNISDPSFVTTWKPTDWGTSKPFITNWPISGSVIPTMTPTIKPTTMATIKPSNKPTNSPIQSSTPMPLVGGTEGDESVIEFS